MLVRFFVENFLSFRDEVEFSMVAGESDEHPDHVAKIRDLRLLKTSVIYGANASGKTNLIKAMSFAQDFITSGKRGSEYNRLTPFLLDKESGQKPSRFEFELKCGIKMLSYIYGFLLDSNRVHSEWLYEIKSASETMMFERETDAEGHTNVKIGEVNVLVTNEEEPFDFIRKFRPNELFLTAVNTEWSEDARDDAGPTNGTGESDVGRELRLFVQPTTATSFSNLDTTSRVENRIAYLDIIFDWFHSTLAPIFTDSVPATGLPIGLLQAGELQKRYLDVVGKLDLGIDDIGLKEIPGFDAEVHLSHKFKESAKQFIEQIDPETDQRAVFYNYRRESYVFADANADFSEYKMATIHRVRDTNNKIFFDLQMESDGTRRLLKLIPALFGLLNKKADYVFVLDELDRSLHTQLSYKLMELFLENSGNRKSQLIVTTHDTSLLDLDLLRRDEIWLLEKDGHGVSSLFSLEEFKLVDKMNIEKGYLGGRFGAIPILSSFDVFEWAK